MASGSFQSSLCMAAGSGYYRYIEVVWSSTNDTENNKSTITWTAYSRSPDPGTSSWVMAKNIVVTINGTATTIIGSTAQKTYKDGKLGGSTITVSHEANGKKSVDVSITAQIYTYGTTNSSYTGSITMSQNPVYTLSISADTGSFIAVNRTACAGSGGTGNLSAGTKKLYYGDKLKITFSPNTNYKLLTNTVNSSTFTSGNTHTVTGDVEVASTAQILASSIGATNANIGDVSTIIVTKYNTAYYHTLQYSFGRLSGYITSNGGVSSTASKFKETSVAFTIPTSFYAQIPNAKTGVCTITCKTYSSSNSITQLGDATTCQIIVTATGSPNVSGAVVDINNTTIALTGDPNKLIRYKSTAQATITATAQNSSSISTKCINDVVPTDNVRTFTGVSTNSFVFKATDSRGYSTSKTVTSTMIAYVALTCNPIIYRPTPTGSSIMMSFSGNIYRGSFGACSNTLTLQYRYKISGGSYGSWQTVDSTNIVFGTSTYRSLADVSLGDDFDYQANYVFQVRVTDGGTVDGTSYTLSSVTKTVDVKKGIPVFDWGENDFNVNVALMLNSVNILNIIYPVGTVYMHSSGTMPIIVSQVGTWESVTTGITGVYAWKRTA